MAQNVAQVDYHGEAELMGFGAGAVLGGMVFGIFADVTAAPPHTMAWFAAGGVVGSLVGAAAASVVRRRLGL